MKSSNKETAPADISVVLCAYNGEKYIREQIQSILCQTLMPKEIIITDDCSTDGTWDIICSYKKTFPDLFKIYRNEHNIGANFSFEKSLKLASCNFVAPSDQDDIWVSTKLELCYDIFVKSENIKNANVVISFCQDGLFSNTPGIIEQTDRQNPTLEDMIFCRGGEGVWGHT